ncbi:Hypothetical_protein [Hexamita inflata]|uniref:Hypothetical_protein n=1 Tax=Hexamita inflata TaxID=28002 RepID=A0AA86UUN2_9EUKA|nr:Hypothetical protein HINF_LOCUS37773 [Hexamita inflata]
MKQLIILISDHPSHNHLSLTNLLTPTRIQSIARTLGNPVTLNISHSAQTQQSTVVKLCGIPYQIVSREEFIIAMSRIEISQISLTLLIYSCQGWVVQIFLQNRQLSRESTADRQQFCTHSVVEF